MPNLTRLETQSEGETDKTVTLSPTSLNLCLALLDGYAWPYQWFGWDEDGGILDLTDAELERAAGYQARAVVELLTEVTMIPIGTVLAWPTTTAPDKWLMCDGVTYQTADYPALYAVIGTTFGGSVGSTFQVPDLVGRYVQMAYPGQSEYIGTVLGTKMQTKVPQHKHAVPRQSATATRASVTMGTGAIYLDTTDTGEAGGVDQRPPTLCLNYIIFAGV